MGGFRPVGGLQSVMMSNCVLHLEGSNVFGVFSRRANEKVTGLVFCYLGSSYNDDTVMICICVTATRSKLTVHICAKRGCGWADDCSASCPSLSMNVPDTPLSLFSTGKYMLGVVFLEWLGSRRLETTAPIRAY